jgi:hypothetical protein
MAHAFWCAVCRIGETVASTRRLGLQPTPDTWALADFNPPVIDRTRAPPKYASDKAILACHGPRSEVQWSPISENSSFVAASNS